MPPSNAARAIQPLPAAGAAATSTRGIVVVAGADVRATDATTNVLRQISTASAVVGATPGLPGGDARLRGRVVEVARHRHPVADVRRLEVAESGRDRERGDRAMPGCWPAVVATKRPSAAEPGRLEAVGVGPAHVARISHVGREPQGPVAVAGEGAARS